MSADSSRDADAPGSAGGASGFRWPLYVLLAALCVLAAYTVWQGRPQPVAELPAADLRLQCVSYAPYRRPGETPFDESTRVPRERIELDLKLLRAVSGCVRIYSVDQGLDAVPAVARSLGMKVLLGAWLGRDTRRNAVELDAAIALAREYKDVVTALIVGNEVLLRRELPVEAIARYLDKARASVDVPVTYADVWEFWLTNQALAAKVSFATIHILPYWEDEPVAIGQAVDHVLRIVAHVRERMPGTQLMIGETGWPSAGRSRREAAPSLVNQARFVRELANAAPRLGVPYNFIEGFDQPWKRRLEGAMGGHWGLLDSEGAQKFALSGPVVEDAGWRTHLYRGGAAAVAGLVVALLMARRGTVGAVGSVGARAAVGRIGAVGAIAGALLGLVLSHQWGYQWLWNRDLLEWSVTSVYILVGTALFVLCAVVAIDTARDPGGASGVSARLVGALAALRMALLFGAAVMMTLLVFDSRYRGFPWPMYALPALGLALIAPLKAPALAVGVQEKVLAWIVSLGVIPVLIQEHGVNREALCFVVLMLLLAAFAVRFDYRLSSSSRPAMAPTAANS